MPSAPPSASTSRVGHQQAERLQVLHRRLDMGVVAAGEAGCRPPRGRPRGGAASGGRGPNSWAISSRRMTVLRSRNSGTGGLRFKGSISGQARRRPVLRPRGTARRRRSGRALEHRLGPGGAAGKRARRSRRARGRPTPTVTGRSPRSVSACRLRRRGAGDRRVAGQVDGVGDQRRRGVGLGGGGGEHRDRVGDAEREAAAAPARGREPAHRVGVARSSPGRAPARAAIAAVIAVPGVRWSAMSPPSLT